MGGKLVKMFKTYGSLKLMDDSVNKRLKFISICVCYRKNHAHAKKVGAPQNFFLAFNDELEKYYSLKKLLKWADKKVTILIFTMLYSFRR